jgi:hypothetical protein
MDWQDRDKYGGIAENLRRLGARSAAFAANCNGSLAAQVFPEQTALFDLNLSYIYVNSR